MELLLISLLEADFSLDRGSFTLNAKLSFQSNSIVGVQGQMGAGKSTFFHCLAGLFRPQNGYLRLGTKEYMNHEKKLHLPPYKRAIAYLFQEDRIFKHLSVRSNLLYGHKHKKNTPTRMLDQGEVIEVLGLGPLLKRRANQMSGGESRRLALGRALLSHFDLLLLDEPFRSLSEEQAQALIAYLKQCKGISILFASHNEKLFADFAQRVVPINQGQLCG